MERFEMAYTEHYAKVMQVLTGRGLLLAAYDKAGRANAMTIGWGSLGSIWGMPVWVVLVRPSRYTYDCISHSKTFSVNVPGRDLEKACMICGSESGRQQDKLAKAGLTIEAGTSGGAPGIAQCPIVYQCRVVHSNFIVPGELVRQLQEGPYANGDYHRIYYGQILSTRAAANAAELL